MTSTFSASTTASTTPTLSKRRGLQVRAASELVHDDTIQLGSESDTPFPRKPASTEALREHGADDRTSEDDEAALPDPTNTQRTVRRKKSSLGLRDVFLAGGAGPN